MKDRLINLHRFCVKYHIYYYFVMILLLALDLVSKKVLEAFLLERGGRVEVIKNFFTLSLVYNPGAFSGMLGGNLFGQIILVLLSLVCGVLMIYYFVKAYAKLSGFERFGLLLAIPGTLGNLVDRFLMVFDLQEGVIDFLEFNLGFMVWNTFNIADSLLVVGIIAFAIGYLIRDHKEEKNKQKEREEFYSQKNEEDSSSKQNDEESDS